MVTTLVFGGLATAFLGYAPGSLGMTATILAAVGLLVSGVGGAGLLAFAAVIYPTATRSTGVGAAMGLGRFGQVSMPLAVSFIVGAGFALRSGVRDAWLDGRTRGRSHTPASTTGPQTCRALSASRLTQIIPASTVAMNDQTQSPATVTAVQSFPAPLARFVPFRIGEVEGLALSDGGIPVPDKPGTSELVLRQLSCLLVRSPETEGWILIDAGFGPVPKMMGKPLPTAGLPAVLIVGGWCRPDGYQAPSSYRTSIPTM